LIVLVCLSAAAIAQKAPPSKPFERFDGCVLEPDEWTDGDSFRVRLPDSDEQAAYFGLTRAQAIELGRQAKIFTARALSQPFTIYTRWRSVFEPTRYYAIVITRGGRDLNELLVSSGLARIYGTRTPLPDGRDSREYLAHLHALENEAKAAKRGGWGMVTSASPRRAR
jgi:endonuclease YncB( thermonuclease family)